jgi:hypothetical protein
MAKPKLHVVSAGKEHHIRVPTSHCRDLAAYLLGNRVVVSRPAPCTPDTQTVTIVGKIDAKTVQQLLNRWE